MGEGRQKLGNGDQDSETIHFLILYYNYILLYVPDGS